MTDAFYPPPPRIRLRVGVSGHRQPPKLPAQSLEPLGKLVDRILATVVATAHNVEGDYIAHTPAVASTTTRASEFVIVSSLAEGADRLVAEAGLKAGFGLEAVLPLERAEYARDFETSESRAQFEQLLARASSIFELPAQADDRDHAYAVAGFVMLAHIDILIAIWDGEDAAGLGGTAEIVSRAITGGIPIVWIRPQDPETMRIWWPRPGELAPASAGVRPTEAFRPADDAEVARAIREIIALPSKPPMGESLPALQLLQRYLAERERRWNLCVWYPLLLWIFRVRSLRATEFELPPALADTQAEWKQDYFGRLPQDRALRPAIDQILLPAFSAADHLAVFYSLVYRSAYVFNFLFSAIAVAVALGGLFADLDVKIWLVAIEFIILSCIVFMYSRGHRWQWHRRWMDYRRLADSLRHLRILAPIGSEGSVDRPGRKLDVDEEDWVDWYAWSLRRLLPLPDTTVDDDYLEKMKSIVLAEISGQIGYHTANAKRMHNLDHRLHNTGQLILKTTLGLAVLFFVLVGVGVIKHQHHSTMHLFTLFGALLPTLGAALSGIHVQGDFRSVSEQSHRTKKRLEALVAILNKDPLSFALLADRIERATDIMMADLLEWQTIFRTRPLAPPA